MNLIFLVGFEVGLMFNSQISGLYLTLEKVHKIDNIPNMIDQIPIIIPITIPQ